MLLVHVPASMGHKIWGQFSKTAMCGSTCDILTPLYFGAFAGNVAYGDLWGGPERGRGVTQDTALLYSVVHFPGRERLCPQGVNILFSPL